MEDKLKIESNLVKSIENEEPLSSANFKDAEKINFKALPEKIYETDEFGFMKKNLKELSKSEMKKQNARIEKWNKMLDNPANFNVENKKLKERARKGVPDPLRRLVWAKFASVEEYVEENEGVYEKFKATENPDKEIENVILRDINRTFPNHSHFNEKYGEGCYFKQATQFVQCFELLLYFQPESGLRPRNGLLCCPNAYLHGRRVCFLDDSLFPAKIRATAFLRKWLPWTEKKFFCVGDADEEGTPKMLRKAGFGLKRTNLALFLQFTLLLGL